MPNKPKIPVYSYQLSANELDTGVYAASLVDEPAIEVDFVALSKQKEVVELKKLPTKQLLYGPLMIPEKPIYRADEMGQYYAMFRDDVIAECAHKFAQNRFNSNITIQHKSFAPDCTVVESWLIEDQRRDKSTALGFNLPAGTWMIGVKVNNKKIWQKVLAGEIKGFSLEGTFRTVPIVNQQGEQTKMSAIDTNATPNINLIELQPEMSKTKSTWYDKAVALFTKKRVNHIKMFTPEGTEVMVAEDGTIELVDEAGNVMRFMLEPVVEAANPVEETAAVDPTEATLEKDKAKEEEKMSETLMAKISEFQSTLDNLTKANAKLASELNAIKTAKPAVTKEVPTTEHFAQKGIVEKEATGIVVEARNKQPFNRFAN